MNTPPPTDDNTNPSTPTGNDRLPLEPERFMSYGDAVPAGYCSECGKPPSRCWCNANERED